MKIKFNSILDPGSAENERILLEVLEECNLGSYLLALSNKIDDNTISSRIEYVFWLKDQLLNKGDIIIVYTRRQGNGIHSLDNANGVKSHFLFWNLDFVLSEKSNKKVVCFETTWSTLSINTEKNTEDASEGI